MIRVLIAAGALLAMVSTAGAAEPKTCSEALAPTATFDPAIVTLWPKVSRETEESVAVSFASLSQTPPALR